MNKKRTVIISVVFALLIALLVVILILINGAGAAQANVYSVEDIVMDSKSEASVTNGKVTDSMTQSVSVDADEKIAEIYVKKGSKVNVGDPLLRYDTRNIEIEIKNRRLAVSNAELNILKARNELEKLKNTKPVEEAEKSAENPGNEKTLNEIVNGLMKPYKGNGTKDNPFVFLVAQGAEISANYIESRCINRTADRYEILEYRENNKFAGVLIYAVELRFKKDGTFDFNLSQTEGSFGVSAESEEYTARQLSYKISEKQLEIENLNIEKALAVNEYERSCAKLSNAVVYASVSGTVKNLVNEQTAKSTGRNLIDIVGKSGWFVQGYISELQLDKVKIGSKVLVSGAKNNVKCSGKIIGISKYPSADGKGNGTGNSNVSYYPFTVEVDSNAKLNVGDEINVNIDENAETTRYILKSFVREENGEHYVLARSSATGLLEKRVVETGATLYGEYIEVKKGISDKDWLAFPYGKSAKTGAQTNKSNQQELFGEMY